MYIPIQTLEDEEKRRQSQQQQDDINALTVQADQAQSISSLEKQAYELSGSTDTPSPPVDEPGSETNYPPVDPFNIQTSDTQTPPTDEPTPEVDPFNISVTPAESDTTSPPPSSTIVNHGPSGNVVAPPQTPSSAPQPAQQATYAMPQSLLPQAQPTEQPEALSVSQIPSTVQETPLPAPSSPSGTLPSPQRFIPESGAVQMPSEKGQIDTSNRNGFINSALPYAQEVESKYGIPASFMMAIAVNEHGGESRFMPGQNNYFGIQGDPSNGTPYTDWRPGPNGEYVEYTAYARNFSTPQEGFDYFANLIANNPRYAEALNYYKQTHDMPGFVAQVQAGGYAEDPEWTSKIVRLAKEMPNEATPNAISPSQLSGVGATGGQSDKYDIAFDFDQDYGSAQFNGAIPRHRGVDLIIKGAANNGRGQAVEAFQGGTVAAITADPNGGNGVIIQMPNGLYQRYFHFDSISVKQGDQITAGQPIGILGASGTEGFPHVHFEVSKGINGDPMDQLIDPRPYMAGAPEGHESNPIQMSSGDEDNPSFTISDAPSDANDQSSSATNTSANAVKPQEFNPTMPDFNVNKKEDRTSSYNNDNITPIGEHGVVPDDADAQDLKPPTNVDEAKSVLQKAWDFLTSQDTVDKLQGGLDKHVEDIKSAYSSAKKAEAEGDTGKMISESVRTALLMAPTSVAIGTVVNTAADAAEASDMVNAGDGTVRTPSLESRRGALNTVVDPNMPVGESLGHAWDQATHSAVSQTLEGVGVVTRRLGQKEMADWAAKHADEWKEYLYNNPDVMKVRGTDWANAPVEQFLQSLPSQLSSLASASLFVAGVLTRNPRLMQAGGAVAEVGLAQGALQQAGGTSQDLQKMVDEGKVSQQVADWASISSGAFEAWLEKGGIEKVTAFGAKEKLEKGLVSHAIKAGVGGFSKTVAHAAHEEGTEEIWSQVYNNALKEVLGDKETGLMDGVLDSYIGGAAGGMAGASLAGIGQQAALRQQSQNNDGVEVGPRVSTSEPNVVDTSQPNRYEVSNTPSGTSVIDNESNTTYPASDVDVADRTAEFANQTARVQTDGIRDGSDQHWNDFHDEHTSVLEAQSDKGGEEIKGSPARFVDVNSSDEMKQLSQEMRTASYTAPVANALHKTFNAIEKVFSRIAHEVAGISEYQGLTNMPGIYGVNVVTKDQQRQQVLTSLWSTYAQVKHEMAQEGHDENSPEFHTALSQMLVDNLIHEYSHGLGSEHVEHVNEKGHRDAVGQDEIKAHLKKLIETEAIYHHVQTAINKAYQDGSLAELDSHTTRWVDGLSGGSGRAEETTRPTSTSQSNALAGREETAFQRNKASPKPKRTGTIQSHRKDHDVAMKKYDSASQIVKAERAWVSYENQVRKLADGAKIAKAALIDRKSLPSRPSEEAYRIAREDQESATKAIKAAEEGHALHTATYKTPDLLERLSPENKSNFKQRRQLKAVVSRNGSRASDPHAAEIMRRVRQTVMARINAPMPSPKKPGQLGPSITHVHGTPEQQVADLLQHDAHNSEDGLAHTSGIDLASLEFAPKESEGFSIASIDDYRELMKAGYPFKDWYEAFADKAKQIVGVENLSEFFTLMGITSSMTQWNTNVSATIKVMRSVRELERARQLTRDNVMKITFGNGTGIKKEAIWRLYEQGFVTSSGPKTPTYFGNFVSGGLRLANPYTTQDMWMGRTRGAPHDRDEVIGVDKAYRFSSAIDEHLGREMGITGHQAQAAQWYAIQRIEFDLPDVYKSWQEGKISLGEAVQAGHDADIFGLKTKSAESGDAFERPNTKKELALLKPLLHIHPGQSSEAQLEYHGHLARDLRKGKPNPFKVNRSGAIPERPSNRQANEQAVRELDPQSSVVMMEANKQLFEDTGLEGGKLPWIADPHTVSFRGQRMTIAFPQGNTDTVNFYGSLLSEALSVPAQWSVQDPYGQSAGFVIKGLSGKAIDNASEVLDRDNIAHHELSGMLFIPAYEDHNEDWVRSVVATLKGVGITADQLGEYKGVNGHAESFEGISQELRNRFRSRGFASLQDTAIDQLRASTNRPKTGYQRIKKPTQKQAEDVYQYTLRNGGGSFIPNQGYKAVADDAPVYFVAGAEGHDGLPLLGADAKSASDIADYVEKNIDILSERQEYRLGTWKPEGSDHVVLDISEEVSDREEAEKLGHDRGQLAIFDNKNKEDIQTSTQEEHDKFQEELKKKTSYQVTRVRAEKLGSPDLPSTKEFKDVIANTPGASIDNKGRLHLSLVRYQDPAQPGQRAAQTGVFYSMASDTDSIGYYEEKHGRQAVGPITSVFNRPLFVKAERAKIGETVKDLLMPNHNGPDSLDVDMFRARWDALSSGTDKVSPEVHASILKKHGVDHFDNSFDNLNPLMAHYAMDEALAASLARSAGYDSIISHDDGKIAEVMDIREATYPDIQGRSTLHGGQTSYQVTQERAKKLGISQINTDFASVREEVADDPSNWVLNGLLQLHLAVAHDDNARFDEQGRLAINLARWQKHEQEGTTSGRTGVFYATPSKLVYYQHGDDYGGSMHVQPMESFFNNPLTIQAGSGGQGPDLILQHYLTPDRHDDLLYDIDKLARKAKTPMVQRVKKILQEYGGSDDVAYSIAEHSKNNHQRRFAITENIVATLARDKGYDSIVVVRNGTVQEVFDLREMTFPNAEGKSLLHDGTTSFQKIDAFHMSRSDKLESVDPSFQGTGQAGAEMRRIKADPLGHAAYSNWYTNKPESRVEVHRFGGLPTYHTTMEITNEPGGLVDWSKTGQDTYKQIKDKGYTGIWFPTKGQVHLFEPVRAKMVGRGPTLGQFGRKSPISGDIYFKDYDLGGDNVTSYETIKKAEDSGQAFARYLADGYVRKVLGKERVQTKKIKPDIEKYRQLAIWGYSDEPTVERQAEIFKAYKVGTKEIADQYKWSVDHGMVFEPFGAPGEPWVGSDPYQEYAKRWNEAHPDQKKILPSTVIRMDIAGKLEVKDGNLIEREGAPLGHHLWVYDDEHSADDHMSQEDNWQFRAVHDLFGHATGANSFGAIGEINAAMEHSTMFTEEAWSALAMELQWQNAYTNYYPGHESLPVIERPFAPQRRNIPPTELTRREDAFVNGQTEDTSTGPLYQTDEGRGQAEGTSKGDQTKARREAEARRRARREARRQQDPYTAFQRTRVAKTVNQTWQAIDEMDIPAEEREVLNYVKATPNLNSPLDVSMAFVRAIRLEDPKDDRRRWPADVTNNAERIFMQTFRPMSVEVSEDVSKYLIDNKITQVVPQEEARDVTNGRYWLTRKGVLLSTMGRDHYEIADEAADQMEPNLGAYDYPVIRMKTFAGFVRINKWNGDLSFDIGSEVSPAQVRVIGYLAKDSRSVHFDLPTKSGTGWGGPDGLNQNMPRTAYQEIPKGYKAYYHGSASAFGAPRSSAFSSESMHGAGYYLTSDPRVAGGIVDDTGHQQQVGYAGARAKGKLNEPIPAQDRQDILNKLFSVLELENKEGVEFYEGEDIVKKITQRMMPKNVSAGDLTYHVANILRDYDARPNQPNLYMEGARQFLEENGYSHYVDPQPYGHQVRRELVPDNLNLYDMDGQVEVDDVRKIIKASRTVWGDNVANELEAYATLGGGYKPLDAEDFHREIAGVIDDEHQATVNSDRYEALDEANTVLEEAGYDGITHTGGRTMPLFDDSGNPVTHKVVIVLPKALGKLINGYGSEKPYGRTAYERIIPFKSGVQKAIESWPSKEGSVALLKKHLTKMQIRADELHWTGLDTYLQLKGGVDGMKKVSRDEVLAFAKANDVKIREQEYSEHGSDPKALPTVNLVSERSEDSKDEPGQSVKVHEYSVKTPSGQSLTYVAKRYPGESSWDMYNNEGKEFDTALSDVHIRQIIEKDVKANYPNTNTSPKTKYGPSRYVLPGGVNHRELVLWTEGSPTTPMKPWSKADEFHFGEVGEGRNILWLRVDDRFTKSDADRKGLLGNKIATAKIYLDLAKAQNSQAEIDKYQNQLSDAEAELATLSGDKKTLFVEELQSNRHQAGKESGYTSPDTIEAAKMAYIEAFNAHRAYRASIFQGEKDAALFARKWSNMTDEQRTKLKELEDKVESAKAAKDKAHQGIPEAPYAGDKNWVALAMKRLLIAAQEEGYDSVAWTEGDVQNDRWSLSNYVKSIEFLNHGNGTWDTWTTFHNDDGYGDNHVERNQTAADLKATFGAEVADKIMNPTNTTNTLTPSDLEVGGKGMRYFYDNMMPATMQKIVNPFGIKVQTVPMTTNTGSPMMKYIKIEDGHKVGSTTDFTELQDWIDSEFAPSDDERYDDSNYSIYDEVPESNRTYEAEPITMHYVELNDKAKESIEKGGFTSFERIQKDSEKQGRYSELNPQAGSDRSSTEGLPGHIDVSGASRGRGTRSESGLRGSTTESGQTNTYPATDIGSRDQRLESIDARSGGDIGQRDRSLSIADSTFDDPNLEDFYNAVTGGSTQKPIPDLDWAPMKFSSCPGAEWAGWDKPNSPLRVTYMIEDQPGNGIVITRAVFDTSKPGFPTPISEVIMYSGSYETNGFLMPRINSVDEAKKVAQADLNMSKHTYMVDFYNEVQNIVWDNLNQQWHVDLINNNFGDHMRYDILPYGDTDMIEDPYQTYTPYVEFTQSDGSWSSDYLDGPNASGYKTLARAIEAIKEHHREFGINKPVEKVPEVQEKSVSDATPVERAMWRVGQGHGSLNWADEFGKLVSGNYQILQLSGDEWVLIHNGEYKAYTQSVEESKWLAQLDRDDFSGLSDLHDIPSRMPEKQEKKKESSKPTYTVEVDSEGNEVTYQTQQIAEEEIAELNNKEYQDVDAAEIGVKELLQNSIDELRNIHGRDDLVVRATVDEEAGTIDVYDNADGITPEVARDQLVNLAGSKKKEGVTAGGFGRAKNMFLGGSKSTRILSVSQSEDGTKKVVVLFGSGEEYKTPGVGMAIVSGTWDGVQGRSDVLNAIPEPWWRDWAFDENGEPKTGTRVLFEPKPELSWVKSGIKPNGQNRQLSQWGLDPLQKYIFSFKNSSKLGDKIGVEFVLNGGVFRPESYDPVNNLLADLKIDAHTHVEIWASRTDDDWHYGNKDYDVLNNGLPQLTGKTVKVPKEVELPKKIIANVVTDLNPKSAAYPWKTDRTDVTSKTKDAIERFIAIELAQARLRADEEAARQMLMNGVSIPGTKQTVVNTTRAFSDDQIKELAQKQYVKYIAFNLNGLFKDLHDTFTGDNVVTNQGSITSTSRFIGLDTNDTSYGTNYSLAGLSKNHSWGIVINPWIAADSVDKLGNSAYRQKDPKKWFARELAEWLYDTMVHEFAHNEHRNHEPGHNVKIKTLKALQDPEAHDAFIKGFMNMSERGDLDELLNDSVDVLRTASANKKDSVLKGRGMDSRATSYQQMHQGPLQPGARRRRGGKPRNMAAQVANPNNVIIQPREANLGDIISGGRMSNMLSGAQQVAMQVIGNMTMMPLLSTDFVRNIWTGSKGGLTGIYRAEANWLAGLVEGVPEFIHEVPNILLDRPRKGQHPNAQGVIPGRLRKPSNPFVKAAWYTDKVLGALPRLFVESPDVLFWGGFYHAKVNQLAGEVASARKLKGQQWWDAVDLLRKNVPKDIHEKATQYADIMTFKNDPDHIFGDIPGYLHKAPLGVGQLALPFWRTNANIQARGYDMLPGFTFMSAIINKMIDNGKGKGANPQSVMMDDGLGGFQGLTPKQRRSYALNRNGTIPMDMRIGLQVYGAAVAYAAIPLILNGLITGSGPDDKKKKDDLWALGWRPNSFLWNGVYYPIRMLGFMAVPLGLLAAWVEDGMYGNTTGKEGLDRGLAVVKAFIKVWANTGYTDNFADFLTMFTSPQGPNGGAGWEQKMVYPVTSTVMGYVPLSGLMRSIANWTSGPQKEVEKIKDVGIQESVTQQFKSQIPGLRSQLANRQNALGDEEYNPKAEGIGYFLPGQSFKKAEPVVEAMLKAGVGVPTRPSKIADPSWPNHDISLTPEEQRLWQRYYGENLRRYWNNWKQPTDAGKLDQINKLANEDADTKMNIFILKQLGGHAGVIKRYNEKNPK